MSELPPLAAVPPPAVRKIIPNEEWEACLDAWILLIEIRLRLSDAQFGSSISKDSSTASFLGSYFSQLATSDDSALHAGLKARSLRRICFLLTRRSLLEGNPPTPELLDWRFLGDFSACYSSSSALRKLLEDTWNKHEDTITSSIDRGKSLIIKQLSFPRPLKDVEALLDIRRLTLFASCLPAAGRVLIAGSDYLDTLFDAYKEQKSDEIRSVLVANVYVGLISLLKGPKANMSLLLDQLFSLKAAAGAGQPTSKREPTLLSDLVCGSDFLIRMERYLSVSPQKRAQDLVSSLRQYQSESKHLHHRYQRHKKKTDKGKGRAQETPNLAEVHVHKMSLITQIQDLFPALGSGYVLRLLDFFGDNPETIIAHLLDNSLPPELQTLDKTEQLPETHATSNHDVMSPRPTPPQLPSPSEPAFARKNIYDNEIDFVELARSSDEQAQKLHFGRVNRDLTADAMLNDSSKKQVRKAAILSALATFDSDDDERDDTYDVADVGGTIDSVPTGTDAEAVSDIRTRRSAAADETELSLFRAYNSNPGLFGRDSATRRSQPRLQLKRETGMTDEAIEGWAVMLARDPKLLSKLESKLTLAAGGAGGGAGAISQPELPSTSYRKPRSEDEEDEEEETSGGPAGPASRGRGGPSRGGRGRGRGGRGRGGRGGSRGGGNVAGPSGDKDTTIARQKKDANKASRANHNRRDQRAKKMARGGGLPG